MQTGDGCSMAASAVWGRCTKVDPGTNRTDDCNQFEPTLGNERKCECCEHHRSHYETPEQVASRIAAALVAASGNVNVASPVRLQAVSTVPIARSSPRLTAKRLSLGGDSPALKRSRDDPGPSRNVDAVEGDTAADRQEKAWKGKVKVEPRIEEVVKEDKINPKIPEKLKQFWDRLVKEYPHAEHGEYKLFRNAEGVWMVLCELCKEKKPKGYDTGHNYSLSNFKKQHFLTKHHQTKLTE